MSTAWVPPGRTYHLRVFVICLVVVLMCLVGFLFGVHMEAIVPATGVIEARGQQEARGALAGLIELGWHEGKITDSAGAWVIIRLDSDGNGGTDPTQGSARAIRAYQLPDGQKIAKDVLRFHPLEVGDVLWPGQVLARVRADDLETRLRKLQGRLQDETARGAPTRETQEQLDLLRKQRSRAPVAVPSSTDHWLVLKLHVEANAAVPAGAAVALVAPVDAVTKEPRDLIVRLRIADKHAGELALKQDVRVYLNMYNQRLHGHADARIDQLEPWGDGPANGERQFTALASITQTPYTLKLGAACKAEIVVGQRRVYRLILEQ
jgi:hypothetical protein